MVNILALPLGFLFAKYANASHTILWASFALLRSARVYGLGLRVLGVPEVR
jgi:hypothetical protein